MRLSSTSLIRRLALGVVLVTAVTACNGGGDGDRASDEPTTETSARDMTTTPAQAEAAREQIAARTKKWDDYNAERTKYEKKQNAVAIDVATRIAAGGVPCPDPANTRLAVIVGSYTRQGLPLPLGAAECTAVADGEENVLIEVFAKGRPNAADLVAAKRKLLCERAKDLGRLSDGTSGFPGIPYVIAADKTWVVQPDSFETNEKIAQALGRTSEDMCEGIE